MSRRPLLEELQARGVVRSPEDAIRVAELLPALVGADPSVWADAIGSAVATDEIEFQRARAAVSELLEPPAPTKAPDPPGTWWRWGSVASVGVALALGILLVPADPLWAVSSFLSPDLRVDTDTEVIEGPLPLSYEDRDSDQFGGRQITADEFVVARTDVGGDCDDTDATINPRAIERAGDAVDQDCDGANDPPPPTCTDFVSAERWRPTHMAFDAAIGLGIGAAMAVAAILAFVERDLRRRYADALLDTMGQHTWTLTDDPVPPMLSPEPMGPSRLERLTGLVDIRATVRETARRAFVTLVWARGWRSRDLTLLVERSPTMDAWSERVEGWIRGLDGVHVQRRRWSPDPAARAAIARACADGSSIYVGFAPLGEDEAAIVLCPQPNRDWWPASLRDRGGVYPVTPDGVLAALEHHATGVPVSVPPSRPVETRDMARAAWLARVLPFATRRERLALHHRLDRSLPAEMFLAPESVIHDPRGFLRALSDPWIVDEAATRAELRAHIDAAEPPVGTIAHLRWRRDRAFFDLAGGGIRAVAALDQLAALATSPIGDTLNAVGGGFTVPADLEDRWQRIARGAGVAGLVSGPTRVLIVLGLLGAGAGLGTTYGALDGLPATEVIPTVVDGGRVALATPPTGTVSVVTLTADGTVSEVDYVDRKPLADDECAQIVADPGFLAHELFGEPYGVSHGVARSGSQPPQGVRVWFRCEGNDPARWHSLDAADLSEGARPCLPVSSWTSGALAPTTFTGTEAGAPAGAPRFSDVWWVSQTPERLIWTSQLTWASRVRTADTELVYSEDVFTSPTASSIGPWVPFQGVARSVDGADLPFFTAVSTTGGLVIPVPIGLDAPIPFGTWVAHADNLASEPFVVSAEGAPTVIDLRVVFASSDTFPITVLLPSGVPLSAVRVTTKEGIPVKVTPDEGGRLPLAPGEYALTFSSGGAGGWRARAPAGLDFYPEATAYVRVVLSPEIADLGFVQPFGVVHVMTDDTIGQWIDLEGLTGTAAVADRSEAWFLAPAGRLTMRGVDGPVFDLDVKSFSTTELHVGRCSSQDHLGPIPARIDIESVDDVNAAIAAVSGVRIPFDCDSASIPEAAKPTLDDVAGLAKRFDLVIVAAGHVDERGTTDFNLATSMRAADAVKQYLVAEGVQVRTLSYGEERPLNTAHTVDAYAENRRVELSVASAKPRPCFRVDLQRLVAEKDEHFFDIAATLGARESATTYCRCVEIEDWIDGDDALQCDRISEGCTGTPPGATVRSGATLTLGFREHQGTGARESFDPKAYQCTPVTISEGGDGVVACVANDPTAAGISLQYSSARVECPTSQ